MTLKRRTNRMAKCLIEYRNRVIGKEMTNGIAEPVVRGPRVANRCYRSDRVSKYVSI